MTVKKWGDETTPLGIYIVYDKSGSMASKQEEALSSTNADIRALDLDTVVTVVAFSSNDPHSLVRDHVTVREFQNIEPREVIVGGWTPLYDAVGKMLDGIFRDAPKRAVLVVQTDGQENTSKEYTLAAINARIAEAKRRGYEVIFLGSEFDEVYGQAKGLGVGRRHTINRVAGRYDETSSALAGQTRGYAVTGQSMNFTDADKVKLGDNG